jgi:multiple antibiotic resistance protein
LIELYHLTVDFLSLTQDLSAGQRRRTAVQLTCDVVIICFILYFLGNAIFSVFGITLEAFRIGAGVLLFLSAVDLVRGTENPLQREEPGSFVVVPLAIPITVGPATTGTLLVMGAEVTSSWEKLVGCIALVGAVLSVGVLLFLATTIEKIIGRTGLRIMSKITGLVLSALAAQMVFIGVRHFLA